MITYINAFKVLKILVLFSYWQILNVFFQISSFYVLNLSLIPKSLHREVKVMYVCVVLKFQYTLPC